MKICVVDNGGKGQNFSAVLTKTLPQTDVVSISNQNMKSDSTLVTMICSMDPDMIFMNAEAGSADIIPLTASLRKCLPEAGIVLVSDDSSYAAEAFRLHIQGYLIRPVTEEMIRSEYDYYIQMSKNGRRLSRSGHDFVVRAFGDFDFFIDGKPVTIKRTKTRELLAYLIDRRGAMVSDSDLLKVLWGRSDASVKSYLRILKTELISIFNDAGYGDAIVKQRGLIGVRTDLIKCDYFDAIRNDPPDLSRYYGEYMRQYEWGSATRKALNKLKAQQSKQQLVVNI